MCSIRLHDLQRHYFLCRNNVFADHLLFTVNTRHMRVYVNMCVCLFISDLHI
jgi:hypothetical protein